MNLVRCRHVFVEDFFRDHYQGGVSHPSSIVAIGGLAFFIGAHFRHGGIVRGGVVFDRNLRRHATHRRRISAMASFHQEQRVTTHKWAGHRDVITIGEYDIFVVAKFFNATENVVPAAAIQSRRMLAQLIQNFVHLEGSENGFDQHGRLDRALRDAEFLLGDGENIVPQTCFQMAFHFWQIEIGAGAFCHQRFDVMEKIHAEIEHRTGHRLAVDQHMLLDQVPAARAH